MSDIKKYWQDLSADEKKRIAKSCRSSVNYLRHVFHGRRPAGWQMSIDIENATNGDIPRATLRPDIFGDTAA